MQSKIHISNFITMVENIQVTSEELEISIKDSLEDAYRDREVKIITYAGMFDIVAYPNGCFQFVPFNSFKFYEIEDDMIIEVS